MVAALVGPEILTAIVSKAIGSVAGAIAALVYLPPRSWRDFLSRLVIGIMGGMILEPYVRSWLEMNADFEGRLAGAFIAAVCSWQAMGLVNRMVVKVLKAR